MKKIFIILYLLSLGAWAVEVTVSILPQKFFIEQIAKDKIKINVMVTKGFSPAIYEPKTSQMRALSSSMVYFSIGVPFESVWLDKFKNSNKNMLIVDTSKGIKKLEMEEHDHHEEESHHDEDKEEAHNDEDKILNPHIWLDPILVKTQIKIVYETLIKLDSKNAQFYLKNYTNFLKELDLLDAQIKAILKESSTKEFMVFHPSWDYFALRYDLEQIAVEVQGKEPKPKELITLIKDAKKHEIKVVFTSPQFSKKAASVIARSINAKVETIDSLEYEYKTNLLKVARAIKEASL